MAMQGTLGWQGLLRPGMLAVALLCATPGFGQGVQQFAPSNTQSTPNLLPPTPLRPSLPPTPAPVIQLSAGQAALAVTARFGRDLPQPINAGLLWRIYPAKPDPARAFRPVKEERSASPIFALSPGDYVVHVSFGLASATKLVSLRPEGMREVLDIPAGAIRLEGRVADAKIPAGQISFDIYPGSQFDPADRRPIAQGVGVGEVTVVPEGTYYIVSNYGEGNAVVRSDIRVNSAKLTDVVISHRAAVILLKLVRNTGGEALANTEWSVLTPAGDVIKESIGAFPKVVLAEGEYRAIARYEGRTYERNFKVTTGVDGEIEVLAR